MPYRRLTIDIFASNTILNRPSIFNH